VLARLAPAVRFGRVGRFGAFGCRFSALDERPETISFAVAAAHLAGVDRG